MNFIQHYEYEEMNLRGLFLKEFPMELLNFKEMKVLDLFDTKLISIPPEIGELINIKILFLSHNKLTSIPPEIGQLVNIEVLDFSYNKLTSILPELRQLINLQRLYLYGNQLTSFPKELGQLVNLKGLDLSNNQLTSIPIEIGQLVNLKVLYLHDNQLTSIPPELGQLVNLQELDLSHNELTFIPPELGQLRNIRSLYIDNNPIDYLPPPIQRLLDRQNQGQNVYQDKQSIHNSGIQKSFRESVNRLLSKKPDLSLEKTLEEIVSSELSNECKSSLVEYSSREDIHGELNITFGELLIAVWDRIHDHKNKQDILPILSQEMSDALCMCFTGRMTRLVNTLSGFVSDVSIHISDNEQISNLVLLTKEKVIPYNVDSHKALFQKEMEERGYSIDIINEWVSYL